MIKKLLFLTISILFIHAFTFAQTKQSAVQIGWLGGQTKVMNKEANDSTFVVFNAGSVIQTNKKDVILDEIIVSAGFPYPVKYFGRTFNEKFFVSKGYFPDIVQLNWKLESSGDNINRFLLFRKPLGAKGDSILISSISKDEFSFRDEYVEGGVLYKYTLYAEGVSDELKLPYINYIESTGFAFPVGTATGQITYEGGSAVEGVTILAETEGDLKGRSIYLNKDREAYLRYIPNVEDDELKLTNGMTFQAWARFDGVDGDKSTLFNRGNIQLDYDGNQFEFSIGSDVATLSYQAPVDTFFHVSAVYDAKKKFIAVYARKNSKEIDSVRISVTQVPVVETLTPIYIGKNSSGGFWTGYVDDLRLWNKPLGFSEIDRDFGRYLTGAEDGFAAYWKLDAGVATEFYDFSKEGGFDFHENHGFIIRGEWADITPYQSQLSYRGVTDSKGNYIITGFPYETSGSLYTFTPIFNEHEFDPIQQLRFVGPGESIFNQVDFDDISSFKVSGTIFYDNTPFPVEGAYLLIDGKTAVNSEGEVILSNVNGEFTIDVPIGLHSIRVEKQNHQFVEGGRFPPIGSGGKLTQYNFQEPLAGLVFHDSTLVKFAGKVVGGPIEAEKKLGFGLSVNNIGNATIYMRPQKTKDLTFQEIDSLVVSTNVLDIDRFSTEVSFNIRDIEIHPDPASGEFIAMLPPEKYVVSDVRAGKYDFDESFNTTINLENPVASNESYQQVLKVIVSGAELAGYSPYNEGDWDFIFSETRADSIFTIGVDSFYYDFSKDFILRVKPKVNVVTTEDDTRFGDETFTFVNEITGVESEIPLINEDGEFTFGYPVFRQRGEYSMVVELFEEYENIDAGTFDQVPVVDGWLSITNGLAIENKTQIQELNDKGKYVYRFNGGLPNINVDNLNPENSFTQVLDIVAFSGNNGSIQTIWRESNPFRGYLLGGLPTGNNFVTAGPNKIDMILRDPPGTASYAYITEGTSYTSSTSYSLSNEFSQGLNVNVEFGLKTVITPGAAPGAEIETKSKNSIGVGIDITETYSSSETIESTVSFSETISTSDDPNFVGADGDVFIGRSTNIVYGVSNLVDMIPVDQCESCLESSVSGFSLGLDKALRISPEFSTGFVFTQSHIEEVLIPNLKLIRNSFLYYSTQPDTISPVGKPVYISKIAPSDEKFGSSNKDALVWGNQATSSISYGPSYEMIYPDDWDGSPNDTVSFYNQSIEGWIKWLAFNEMMKITSVLDDNRSFDGGTSIENVVTQSATESVDQSFDINISESLAYELGMEVNEAGRTVGIEFGFSQALGESSSSSETTETTYGYVLADGDAGDAYTVDIRKTLDGFGPVFSTRGGATSCPYEGEVATKYYIPGTILSVSTAQREVPKLSVESSIATDIPQNRKAIYTIYLQNNSETGDDSMFDLDLDDTTNPYGAILSVDGSPLGNGLSFVVAAGQTLTKTLTLETSNPDVVDYENIVLTLSSQCDDLSDDISISAYFVPGCSDIELKAPLDQWVLNTKANTAGVLPIQIGNYDLNYENFERIDFQYKAAGSSIWITDMKFYNPSQVSAEEFATLDEPKMFIDGTTISYDFDMADLPDRLYDVRAVSRCVLGPGQEVFTPTETHRGIKDTQRPQVFGSPQPADGVLSANDEISIRFNEAIEAGLITNASLSVKGVLNNAEISHSASVRFDGVNDYVKILDGTDVPGSFTIFGWVRRSGYGKDQLIFSKGYIESDVFEFGYTAADKFYVNVSGQKIETALNFPQPAVDQFEYIAVVYNAATNKLGAYRNGEYILERVTLTNEFSGSGPITLGKSIITEDKHFEGNMHEWRMWSTNLNLSDVHAKSSLSLSGSEVGLIGYWPMDEAYGTIAEDKARMNNANVFADWSVEPGGYAYAFDGVDDYLQISTGSTVTISDIMDFSVEFWFKGKTGQSSAVLFSNGKGDGTDLVTDPEDSWYVGFNEVGKLVVSNNGVEIEVADSDILDDDWHHFTMSVNRIGNINVYLDKVSTATKSAKGFGALLGSKMWIGARGYRASNLSNAVDSHFEGAIDEFRIWNTFRRKSQIELNWHNRLSGDEVGLVAYYPFDSYEKVSGINILTETLEDQFINQYGDNGGLAESVNGPDYTMETPAIKLARPVASVDFDYVVNDDEIIITLAESFKELIEQRILEISLISVEDLNENRLASPVSWTAFIDKNPVKWSIDEVEIEKPIYEAYSFTANVINRGGSEQNFTINNLPAWLTASPSSGVLEPLDETKITFTINSGLNTGYYYEDLYLSSDFGFDEKLSLDVSVVSPAPAWEVDPSKYQYSMNVIAQLKIGGVISTDENDVVAAFVGNEIRGAAHLEYIASLDLYEVYLDIFSNKESGEKLELRVWDASTGIEYREASPIYTFANNTLYGTPKNPQLIETGDLSVQTIDIANGWNWISFNRQAEVLSDVNTLLSQFSAKTSDQIKAQGLNNVAVYNTGMGWFGKLVDEGFDIGKMYQMKISDAGSLELIGSVASTETNIQVEKGWNYLGYVPRFNMSVGEAFASFSPKEGDIVKSQHAFAVYSDGIGWTGSLKSMSPGSGYFFYATKSGSFKYPANSVLNNRIEDDNILEWNGLNRHSYADNMTLIAEIGNANLSSEYALVAYSNGEIRGVAEQSLAGESNGLYFLTIYGQVNDPIEFRVVNINNSETIGVVETELFNSQVHSGSIHLPVSLNVDGAFSNSSSSIVVYPNPIENEMNIQLSEYKMVNEVAIVDLVGRTLKTWQVNEELNVLNFSMTELNLPTGVYVLKIQSGDVWESINIIKQ